MSMPSLIWTRRRHPLISYASTLTTHRPGRHANAQMRYILIIK